MWDMVPPAHTGLDDMGGNPLMEGVWGSMDGGWKNRMKRDESFASVRRAGVIPAVGGVGYHGDLHETLCDIDRRAPGLLINGEPLNHTKPDDASTWPLPFYHKGSVEVHHPNPKVAATAEQVLSDGHSGFWRAKMQAAREKAQQRAQQAQMQPQARVANDVDFDDLFGDDIPNPMDYGKPDGAFVITPQGNVLRGQGQEDHYNISQRHNLRQFPQGYTLGYASTGEPNLRLVQHDSGIDSNQLAGMLSRHFPNHALPETLAPVTNEERWFGPGGPPQQNLEHQLMTPEKQYQIQQAEKSRGKPFGYYNNPWINRGGSVNNRDNRNSLYYPFELDGSKIAGDFEMQAPQQKEAFLPALMGIGTGLMAIMKTPIGRGIASGLVQRAVGGGGRGGGTNVNIQEPSAVGSGPVPDEYLSSVHMELTGGKSDHPMSDDNLTERASGDPEDVDSQEVNDGDHSEWQNDPTTNDIGGTAGFKPEVEQAIEEAMPKLLEYYHSEESGANDPAIAKLLDILQQYDPELLDEPFGPEHEQAIAQHISHRVAMGGGVPGIGMQPTMTGPPMMPQPSTMPVNPTTQENCPHCGGLIQPGTGVCGQCGGALQTAQPPMGDPNIMGTNPTPGQQFGVMGHVAANQGPHSIEQIQAVIDFLKQNGQYTPEIAEDVINNPENYGDILAQIAGRPEPPAPDPDPGAPPPMPDPSQMGGQGMPMGAPPGGMPMMGKVAFEGQTYGEHKCLHCGAELFPDDDPQSKYLICPECGGVNDKLEVAHPDDVTHHQIQNLPTYEAADNAAPPCPNCDSHTTGVESDGGTCTCHACGNTWAPPGAEKTISRVAQDDHPLVQGVPAADQISDDDPMQDINPGIWSTTTGEPLKVGSQYEMYSALYDIPELVKITAVKPDGIEYTIQGEYNLEHRTAVSRQEAQMDGLQFVPAMQAEQPADPTADQLTDDLPNPTDTSTQMPMVSSWTHRLAGKKYTPMEQREFIDEPGEARNSNKLNLENTHYTDEPSLSSMDDYFLW